MRHAIAAAQPVLEGARRQEGPTRPRDELLQYLVLTLLSAPRRDAKRHDLALQIARRADRVDHVANREGAALPHITKL